MALTLPTVVPSQYLGTVADFLQVPQDRAGQLRLVQDAVTIPATTAQNAYVGLIPVQKGARFSIHSTGVHVADLDTSTNVTMELGFLYYDSDDGTTDANAFASASTSPQAGGFIAVDEIEGLSFVALGRGWLAVKVTGGATITEGAVTFAVGVSYDN